MITIICTGSRGDIQPYIALAQQLKILNKNVRIATGKSFEQFVRGYGIDFYPFSLDMNSEELDPKVIEAASSADNPLKMLLSFQQLKQFSILMVEEMYKACEGSELLIYHPGCPIVYFAGRQMGIPVCLASPFPMHQTSERASLITYGRYKLPYSFSHALLQTMLWTVSKSALVSFWKKNFGNLPADFSSPFEKMSRDHQAIISCSNYVFPRPKDWGEYIHQFGYWFVKENENLIIPEDLINFLGSGEKPVYFGFGSVFNPGETDQFIDMISEVLAKSGKRGIIGGISADLKLPDNIFLIKDIPHSWLFNQISAVCHHGGAGTTAAGFAAGVPSIIVPFSNDQYAWAHRAFHLGVASKPIPKKKLTIDNLSDAIKFVSSKEVVLHARILGENIGKENGAEACAKIVVDIGKF